MEKSVKGDKLFIDIHIPYEDHLNPSLIEIFPLILYFIYVRTEQLQPSIRTQHIGTNHPTIIIYKWK